MSSSFLTKLAPELRNIIYELVFQEQDGLLVLDVSDSAVHLASTIHSTPVALTSTCKQVRYECQALLFASNSFLLRTLHLEQCPDFMLPDLLDATTGEPVPAKMDDELAEPSDSWQRGVKAWVAQVGIKNVRHTPALIIYAGVVDEADVFGGQRFVSKAYASVQGIVAWLQENSVTCKLGFAVRTFPGVTTISLESYAAALASYDIAAASLRVSPRTMSYVGSGYTYVVSRS